MHFLGHRVTELLYIWAISDMLLCWPWSKSSFHLSPLFFCPSAFSGCEWGLHGFPVQWQHVPPDLHLQPQRQLLPADRGGRGGQVLQRRHLALGSRHCNHRQHSSGSSGLRLCLLRPVSYKHTAEPPSCHLFPLHFNLSLYSFSSCMCPSIILKPRPCSEGQRNMIV